MNRRTPEPVRGFDDQSPWRMEPGWFAPLNRSPSCLPPACRQTGQAGLKMLQPQEDARAPRITPAAVNRAHLGVASDNSHGQVMVLPIEGVWP
jgi:hypothetical protein